ncbi:MAG: glutamate-5-semialdehyde dehydrogenase [Candidatus Kapaibacterium sp.]|nr:MAG: glutamate-5-semialdehyde dehydrogenase [Candidatus Kapabacteria bacterium]
MSIQSRSYESAQESIQYSLRQTQRASRTIAALSEERINAILQDVADSALKETAFILAENKRDLERMPETDPKYDRLKLTEERIASIAADIRKVAGLSSPLGSILEKKTLENGINLEKISVPMGVIGIVYEARPNVTFDVFALCLKAGSASALKGGSDAEFSNKAIISLIHKVLEKHGITPFAANLLPPDRESTSAILNAVGFVDVIIPRGSQGLIDFVRQNSRVPVIETGAGIVHIYFDASGDAALGANAIFNSKTRRVSVCNALDTVIIHRERLQDLSALVQKCAEKNVQIFADDEAIQALNGSYPASLLAPAEPVHFGTEFLDYKMSIKTVGNLEEALDHIAEYSSKHSEAIIASNEAVQEQFLRSVDAAVVYANTSTAFTDGGQFGLGAEIGISTQKLHARGPMALREITSYKWLARGSGQVRS